MRTVAIHSVGGMTLALACALAVAPATAQSSADDSTQGYAVNAYPSPTAKAPGEVAPAAANATAPDESALLGDTLTFDPAMLAVDAPAKPLRLPGLSFPKALDVSRADGGSGPVVVKQPLSTDWDASVGADISSPSARPGVAMPVTRDNSGTGTAWVQVGVPNFATFDAHVDPTTDQRRIGTTFKQPIGSQFAVTLQNNYSITENGSATAGPSDVPMMTVPRTAVTPMPTSPQIWGNENVAKLDFLPTGTSFAAGVVTASNDPVTHHRLSADQRLYGPLHVTTAVTDVGQPTESKSITAGLRLSW